MYVIIPDEKAERRHANITNVTKRHCRIGKVSPKPPKHWGKPIKPLPGSPMDRFTFQWPAIYSRNEIPAMCRQCIGKNCGNVACPSRLIATC